MHANNWLKENLKRENQLKQSKVIPGKMNDYF